MSSQSHKAILSALAQHSMTQGLFYFSFSTESSHIGWYGKIYAEKKKPTIELQLSQCCLKCVIAVEELKLSTTLLHVYVSMME